MLSIFLSIAPIFTLIVLGHLLRRGGIPNTDFWNLNDKLVYWVLMPALLFYKTSTIDLSLELVGSFGAVILGAFGCATVYGLVAGRVAGLPGTVASSVLQGSSRHNTFLALAIAERMYGGDGLSLAALGTALLIPVTNVSVVSLMVVLVRNPDDGGVLKVIARDLVRNPLLLSVGLGVSVNLLGIGELPVIHDTARILGAAALPIVLMCVGANIQLQKMAASVVPVIVSCIGKMIIFPVAIVLLSQLMGLSQFEMMIALLFGAVPVASSAYTLAHQLGGDAPLMAGIVTIQTALSFLTLPATMLLAQWMMG
jgi:malonate transporter and related proteins